MTLSSLLKWIPLRVVSRFFMVEAFLPEGVRCSEDTTGELLRPLEILRRAAGLTLVVLGWERSASLLIITASRLLEVAARLDDPLDRKKLELGNCMNPSTKFTYNNKKVEPNCNLINAKENTIHYDDSKRLAVIFTNGMPWHSKPALSRVQKIQSFLNFTLEKS